MAVVGSYGALGSTSVTPLPRGGGRESLGHVGFTRYLSLGLNLDLAEGRIFFFPNRLILLVVILF